MARVLVVEDHHEIAELIREVLEDAGMQTVCVKSDRDAYAALSVGPSFEAVVLDINLGSGTTGYDIARRARLAFPKVAVVYVSGQTSAESFQAFGVEGSDLIAKPFTPDEVLETLQRRLPAA
jgi:CheY-like chemotaxis protein